MAKNVRHEKATTSPEAPAARSRLWRWRRVWGFLLVLGLVVWFLPALVAHSFLRTWLLERALARLEGSVTAGGASLGWFSPIVLRDVEVRDAQGEVVLSAATVAGEKSLLATLVNASDAGRYQLERPRLDLVLRNDGTNLEEVLADWRNALAGDPTSMEGVALEVEAVEATARVRDAVSGRRWQVDPLRFNMTLPRHWSNPMRLETSGPLTGPDGAGRFAFTLESRRRAPGEAADESESKAAEPLSAGPVSVGQWTLKTETLPLAALRSLACRVTPVAELSGRLTSEIAFQWDQGNSLRSTPAAQDRGASFLVKADITADDVTLAAPWLGRDRLHLARLTAPCRLARKKDRLVVEQLAVTCDLGQASVTGTVAMGGNAAKNLSDSVAREPFHAEGRVDLARLARLLPNTLRVREGTEITAGQVSLNVDGQPRAAGPAWKGTIEADRLVAVHRGETLAWEKPIRVTFAVHQGNEGPVVDQLRCESSFLAVEASGTTAQLTATANCDLDRLAVELGRFVDLGQSRPAGRGLLRANWKRSADGKFDTSGKLELREFRLAIPGRRVWTEPSLDAAFKAAGAADLDAMRRGKPGYRIDAASLNMTAGADRMDLRLLRPVADAGGVWPLDVQLAGQLDRWASRAEPWLPEVASWELAGTGDLKGKLSWAAAGVDVEESTFTARQFHAWGHGLWIDEPALELKATARWDRAGRQMAAREATFATSALAVRATDLQVTMPPDGPAKWTGVLGYQGDLARLAKWFRDPKVAPELQLAGDLSGWAKVARAGAVTQAQTEATVTNLVATDRSAKPWKEPKVRLAGRGSYDSAADAVKLDQLRLDSDALTLEASGRLEKPGGDQQLDLAGKVEYDLEKVAFLLRPYVGQSLKLVGHESRPFFVRGPLRTARAEAAVQPLKQLVGEAGVGWTSASAYGFEIGKADLKARLADGVLRFDPLDVAVSEGRLSVEPSLRISPEPVELNLKPGPLVRQVRITPAMCAAGLQYIAPVLAGVTTAQGRFSIEMEGCRVPVSEPAKGEMAGKFTIHDVQIGPGPLIGELTTLLGLSGPAKLAHESIVPFRMVNGRVYHRDLELAFPDLVIRTYGSVGLDQTLAIMAEMPVPPKWIGQNPLGTALKNRTIRLPIGGTLQRPQIDRQAFREISREFLRGAAGDLLRDELNKQLENLLKPGKK
ncbi:MAG: AsmA family protein [Pirellulales bacterium]